MSREVWYDKEIKKLVEVIAETNNQRRIEDLFDRILTPREINDIARRLAALGMLEKGASYADIRTRLGLSPVIISRLANKLGYGFRRSSQNVKRSSASGQGTKTRTRTVRYKGIPVYKTKT